MTEPIKTVSTSSLMQENRTFPPSAEVVKRAYINAEQYQKMYDRSINDSDAFWLEQAGTLDWFKKPTVARKYTWDTAGAQDSAHLVRGRPAQRDRQLPRPPSQDRDRNKPRHHLAGRTGERRRQAHLRSNCTSEVCKFANVLKSLGVKKGDRVAIYLPMILELPIAMLACARIGAIHSIVFGGFSADALSGRINDSTCKLLDHLQHLPARRQEHSAQGHRRRSAQALSQHREGGRGQAQRHAPATSWPGATSGITT